MLPITTFTASLLGALFFVLTLRVIKQRGASKVSLGDGGDELLTRRIRAQGNFVEYTPIFLILLMLAELHNVNGYYLAIVAVVFVLARSAHGYALAFSEKNVKARFLGTLFTGIPIVLLTITDFWVGLKLFGL